LNQARTHGRPRLGRISGRANAAEGITPTTSRGTDDVF
jgi:hypothetical protein